MMHIAAGEQVGHLKKGIFSANDIPVELMGHFHVRRTTVMEKAIPSLINAVLAFGIATPLLLIYGSGLAWRWSVVVIFALYEFAMVSLFKDRCLGMKIMDTYWEKDYSLWQHLRYNVLYTLSFATLLISLWVPFDLLFVNLIFVQLPMVLITGTTLHGYVGGMETVRIIKKR